MGTEKQQETLKRAQLGGGPATPERLATERALLLEGPLTPDEIFARVAHLVPSGRAYRVKQTQRRVQGITSPKNTDEADVLAGRRRIINKMIFSAVKAGAIERHQDGTCHLTEVFFTRHYPGVDRRVLKEWLRQHPGY